MIENYLSDELCKFLTKALADMYAVVPPKLGKPPGTLNVGTEPEQEQQAETSENPEIHIFDGLLPPKEPDEKLYPYVSVIVASGTFGETACTCKVVIECGIYSDDNLGHKDLLNLMRRISHALRTLPNYILVERFVLDKQISWSIPTENFKPYWHGALATDWQYYVPQSIDKNL